MSVTTAQPYQSPSYQGVTTNTIMLTKRYCNALLLWAWSAMVDSNMCPPAMCCLCPFVPSVLASFTIELAQFPRTESGFLSVNVSSNLCDFEKPRKCSLWAIVCGLRSSWTSFQPSLSLAVCLTLLVGKLHALKLVLHVAFCQILDFPVLGNCWPGLVFPL